MTGGCVLIGICLLPGGYLLARDGVYLSKVMSVGGGVSQGTPDRDGVPHHPSHRIGHHMGGMPLVFTQEDCLQNKFT